MELSEARKKTPFGVCRTRARPPFVILYFFECGVFNNRRTVKSCTVTVLNRSSKAFSCNSTAFDASKLAKLLYRTVWMILLNSDRQVTNVKSDTILNRVIQSASRGVLYTRVWLMCFRQNALLCVSRDNTSIIVIGKLQAIRKTG